MKQATSLAIISIVLHITLLVIMSLMNVLNLSSGWLFLVFNLFDILTYVGLLPFFIKLYKKQQNGV